MALKYTCPSCGTPLGYEGLCWKCKSEQERKTALAWTPEQITEKQRNLIQNIQRLEEMEDPELTDFWQLLGYRDAITPEIQRAALAAEVFWPCEIYDHAPADVRDGLIHALLTAENSGEASKLLCCLAMQGDDKAMETLLELERNPRPWRKGLYVDPSSYAQIGGWTSDKDGFPGTCPCHQRCRGNVPLSRNGGGAGRGKGTVPEGNTGFHVHGWAAAPV